MRHLRWIIGFCLGQLYEGIINRNRKQEEEESVEEGDWLGIYILIYAEFEDAVSHKEIPIESWLHGSGVQEDSLEWRYGLVIHLRWIRLS